MGQGLSAQRQPRATLVVAASSASSAEQYHSRLTVRPGHRVGDHTSNLLPEPFPASADRLWAHQHPLRFLLFPLIDRSFYYLLPRKESPFSILS